MIVITYNGKSIFIEGDPKEAVKVEIHDVSSKEIMHLTTEGKSYILRATKEKKLILN